MILPSSPEDSVLPDDLIYEIFLRVRPTDPATLFRAAVGSRKWRSFICSHSFHELYTKRHGAPPIVGVFFGIMPYPHRSGHYDKSANTPPMADTQFLVDHIPVDFHHGRLLLSLGSTKGMDGFLVWDPKTGEKTSIALPKNKGRHKYSRATILCAISGCNHNLGCNGGAFEIVCLSEQLLTPTYAFMYSSLTNTWSDVTHSRDCFYPGDPVLIDNVLYYTCIGEQKIVRYNFRGDLSLEMMMLPDLSAELLVEVTSDQIFGCDTVTVLSDGSLGLALLYDYAIHLWSWNSEHRVWIKQKVFDLNRVCTVDKELATMIQFSKDCPPGTILMRLGNGYYNIDLETETHVQFYHQDTSTIQLIPYAAYFLPVPLAMALQGKKLINNPDDVVTEFIEGLVETYPGLQYLDGFPQIKVVLRADVVGGTYDKVAVISGGGSGHEPAHAGFVGPGMLTAAVSGDVFASPPVDSILAAIRAVTGTMGCLLIIKNYTGDRLNFGLAAEQAKSEGYKIEMVIVGDDCALPPRRGIAGRRGLAGTILVHKVAGAAADAGLSLEDVAAEAKHASEAVGTIGVALSVCTLPGQVTSDRLGPTQIELGLGIHGEPGAAVVELQSVDVVVEHVLKQILSQETQYLPITRGSNAVLLINGLGATPVMELMIAARKAVPELQLEYGIAVDRVYTGTFMTALDMAGISITIMRSDEKILQRLDAPTKAPSWPVGSEGSRPPAKFPVPVPPSPSMKDDEILSQQQELTKQGCILEAAIEAGAKELIGLKDSLNDWDSKVGDGDCGTTMYSGATAILEDIKTRYPMNDAAGTINEIGATIRKVMGGTSGILYDILCKAAYASLKQNKTITAYEWSDALEASVAAVSKYGGASAGYRTMLDALIPASTVLKQSLKAGDDPVTAFIASSEAASAGAESTKQMQAKAGRSSYIAPDHLASVPDPGAVAAAAWYRAAALSVKKKLHGAES